MDSSGASVKYVYDGRGNIIQKQVYNSDWDLVDTVNYTYTNPLWTDALTGYDGESFTYDAMGNPLKWTGLEVHEVEIRS